MKIFLKPWCYLRFMLCLFVAIAVTAPCLSFTTRIDTRVGGAQAPWAYIYPNLYTLIGEDDGYYGNVEFRGGIRPTGASATPTLELGIIPAFNGPFYFPSTPTSVNQLWINLRFAMTWGRVSFQSDHAALLAFQWGTSGDTNPYIISLTSDITLGSNVNLLLWSLTSGVTGNFNGNNHTLTLATGSLFSPVSLTGKDMVVQNLRIEGAENVRSTYSGNIGTNIFQNVSIYSFVADDAHAVKMPDTNLVYRGLTNVLGDGGIINFIKSGTSLGTRISAQTELTVTPQTQLLLGHASVPGGSFVTFDDATSLLYLDNCSVEIGGSSSDYVKWQKGTVYINGVVTLKARTGGSYLQLGDGVSSSNDCKLVILPGSQLLIDNGAKLVNKNLSASSITFMDPFTSGFTINTTGTLNNLGVLTVSGVLNAVSSANITGNALSFSNGIYTNGTFKLLMTGQYDTSKANKIRLTGASQQCNAMTYGSIPDRISVSGTGNLIMGTPVFANSNAIQMNSGLTLALQSELNQKLLLNNGTIDLGADLLLSDSVKFSGQGSVNFNGYNLSLGQKDLVWTDSLLLVGATNLILNAKLRLTGRWSFKNDAHIVGNNSILDLTNTGIIMVKRNTTLTMTDLTINGFGSGGIRFESATPTATAGSLVLQNVTLLMDQSETLTNGKITVIGPSTVITGSNFLMVNKNCLLTVNGTSLAYDTVGYNDQNNILFGASVNESLINGGLIRRARSLKLGDFVFSADQILDRSFVVSMLRKLIITNNTTINGAGFGYQFARYPLSPIFTVAAGKRVTFTNVLLQDLPIYNNSFGADSQVIFGDQTTVQLGTNGILNDTWTFSGQVVLSGGGNTLELGTGQLILRPKTSLLIDNLTISGIQGNNIRCMDNNCTLSFGNVIWVQSNTFTLTNSHVELLGTLSLEGTSTFAYTSNRVSTITNGGNLYVDAGMTFSYAPLRSANRDLIVMQTANSLLTLNNATLASTTTGMRLTTGIVDVEGTCRTLSDGAVALSEGIVFGDGNPANDVTINFGAGATLNAETGILVYDNQD